MTERICVRVDEDIKKLMDRLAELGVGYSAQINFALNLVLPLLYLMVERIKVDVQLNLLNEIDRQRRRMLGLEPGCLEGGQRC